MKQQLVERGLDRFGVTRAGPQRGRRSVTVNLAESPLGWLHARGLVDDRQVEAGERLRADYERANLPPRTTMRWDTTPRTTGAAQALTATEAQVAAKRRFDTAMADVGPGLHDIVWRVICAGEGVPAAERALGWPARAGRLVLTLALDRLAAHYRLP